MNTSSDLSNVAIGSGAFARIPLTAEQFLRLRDLLATFGGVYLDTAQQRTLELGLAQRLATTTKDFAQYEALISSADGREELRQLAELVLNHETFFFRNIPHLRALREVFLPEIHQRKPPGMPIRIWSAGCATGEEPYSLAITALETLGYPPTRPIEIWGTDLSEAALKKARVGWYRGRALNNLTPELLARYFQAQSDGYLVGDALRKVVRFAVLNLLEPFPEMIRDTDIIFCQNVTIYFQPETRRNLISRFYDLLPPHGLLFLGFSETLWNVFDGFHSREVSGAYVYYKGALESKSVPAKSYPKAVRPAALAPPAPPRRVPAQSPGAPVVRRTNPPEVKRNAPVAVAPVPSNKQELPQSDQQILHQVRGLLEQGQFTIAIEYLRRIAPQSPFAPQALMLVAYAHADRGDLDLAAAEVHRALEINPLNEEAYQLLGVIYMRQNQWQEAVQQLERARYLNPELSLVSFHLATAYQHIDRAEQAIREYRNALKKLDSHPPGTLLDGVAVEWLQDTCKQQIETLLRSG